MAALMVAILIMGLVSLYFGKFYLLMIQTYNQMSAQADLQRSLRKITAWVVPDLQEASPVTTADQPIVFPTDSNPANRIHFTHVVDLNNYATPAFQTIRYTYDANTGNLNRQVYDAADVTPVAGTLRTVCPNLSSLTFTKLNNRRVLLQFTVTRQVTGANRQIRNISAKGETYISVRYNQ